MFAILCPCHPQDLTQLTFGISRDDAQAKFLTFYRENGLLPGDPFESIDEEGVGELVRLSAEDAVWNGQLGNGG